MQASPPVLAVVLCVRQGHAAEAAGLDPRIVVVELPGTDPVNQASRTLQALRAHPSGQGPAGRRVAYLVLFAGFDDLEPVTQHPEMGTLPILIAKLPAVTPAAVQEAVLEARREINENPGFSVPVRGENPADTGAAPGAIPVGGNSHPTHPTLPSVPVSVVDRLRQVKRATARLFNGEAAMSSTVLEAGRDGQPVGLLAVVTIDGPGVTRAVRTQQKRFTEGLRDELTARSDAPWVASSFRGNEELARTGELGPVGVSHPRAQASASLEEIDLSSVSKGLLAELTLDRKALGRRGWGRAWTAVAFIAPELPHVGVLPNRQFANLAEEADLVVWVGTQVDPLPRPLQVDGACFLTFHADSAREVADLLLGGSGFLRQEEAGASVPDGALTVGE